MPEVKPFKAVIYNKYRVRNLSRVVAPPYDIIPKNMQDELYKKDPHNIVRLILNRTTSKDTAGDNRYTRSKNNFDSWLKEGILTQDDTDSFYIYSQKYKYGKKNIEQIGFIGLMRLDMTGKNKILPHENTLAAPKKDRLNLMHAVRANLSPIFILHDDNKITRRLKDFRAKNRPVMDVKREGVRHLVWKLSDHAIIEAIERALRDKNLFIADGHHRYEVARMYSGEVQNSRLPQALKENSKYMMVYFVEADENMLTILPAHRLIKDLGNLKKSGIIEKLQKAFNISKAPTLKAMMSKLSCLVGGHAFGMYIGKGGFYILELKDASASDKAIKDKPKEWKRLDVSILHLYVFQHLLGVRDTDDNIEFFKNPSDAAQGVDNGRFKAAFFLNPTKPSEVKRIAKLGERMPRKATYFYPKPLSGLVINKH